MFFTIHSLFEKTTRTSSCMKELLYYISYRLAPDETASQSIQITATAKTLLWVDQTSADNSQHFCFVSSVKLFSPGANVFFLLLPLDGHNYIQ